MVINLSLHIHVYGITFNLTISILERRIMDTNFRLLSLPTQYYFLQFWDLYPIQILIRYKDNLVVTVGF